MKKNLLIIALLFGAIGYSQYQLQVVENDFTITPIANPTGFEETHRAHETTYSYRSGRFSFFDNGVKFGKTYEVSELRDQDGNPFADADAVKLWCKTNLNFKSGGGSGSGLDLSQVNSAIASNEANQDAQIASTYQTIADANTVNSNQNDINLDIESRTAINDSKVGISAGQISDINTNKTELLNKVDNPTVGDFGKYLSVDEAGNAIWVDITSPGSLEMLVEYQCLSFPPDETSGVYFDPGYPPIGGVLYESVANTENAVGEHVLDLQQDGTFRVYFDGDSGSTYNLELRYILMSGTAELISLNGVSSALNTSLNSSIWSTINISFTADSDAIVTAIRLNTAGSRIQVKMSITES